MLQELIVIPHQVGSLPVFGLASWSMIVWAILGTAMVVWNYRQNGWDEDCRSSLMVAVIIAFLLAYLLPMLEAPDPIALEADAPPRGLPIRGYGVMMLFGILSGVLLAAHRARQLGIDRDHIYSLTIWMFAGGIVGARAFFVIQYWESFRKDSMLETVAEIMKFTEGGLVVYGSLIGSLIAWVAFCKFRKLPVLAMGDIIAPALMLGLALGRIGCLANGCCYGGVCDSPLPALTFPQFSPPYLAQLETGRLLGLTLIDESSPGDDVELGEGTWQVAKVAKGTIAEEAGVREGDKVIRFQLASTNSMRRAEVSSDDSSVLVKITTHDLKQAYWTFPQLPSKSLPTHPAQVYSSITALLLCAVAWFAFPYLTRDGATLALVLTLYPICRFLLEWIRIDESSQFGTALTISQIVSVGIVVSVLGLWGFVLTRSKNRQVVQN